jgi:hypothetical protein
MALVVVSARVPAADAPVAGVPLTPYVLVRRGDGGAPPASGDDTHDEARGPPPGGGRYALRYRWFRAGLARGPAVCWAHPDREATIQVGMVGGGEGGRAWAWARRPSRGPRRRGVAGLAASSRRWSGFRNDTPTLAASLHPQCVACLRARAGDSRASYHCGPDCLRAHWPFHKELHETKRGGGAGAWAGRWGRGRRKGARCARARWPTLPPSPLFRLVRRQRRLQRLLPGRPRRRRPRRVRRRRGRGVGGGRARAVVHARAGRRGGVPAGRDRGRRRRRRVRKMARGREGGR